MHHMIVVDPNMPAFTGMAIPIIIIPGPIIIPEPMLVVWTTFMPNAGIAGLTAG